MESDMKSSYYLIFISLLLLAGCSSHGDASAQSQSNGMAVAKAAFDSAQYEKAERLYLALLSSDASLEEAQLMLARTSYQQDKKQAARDGLQQLLDRAGQQAPEAANYLGKFLLDDGRTEEAATAYRQGLALPELTPLARARLSNGLGVASLRQGAFAKGRALFEAAVAAAPDEPDYRGNLALGWLMEGNRVAARQAFEPLLHYQSLPPQVEMNYALLLLAEGNEPQARLILSRFLSASQLEHDIRLLKAQLRGQSV
ncbi:tetratricopeptide repeat protein [Aeromonas veronii]|uniref:tetratricopeptide repeat protein n=1 Tax=Aeromonas veronii TaxID=654 RepID=UPI00389AABCD